MTVYMFASVKSGLMYTSSNKGYGEMNLDEAREDLKTFARKSKLKSELDKIAYSDDFYFSAFDDVSSLDEYKALLGEFAYHGCKLVGKPTI